MMIDCRLSAGRSGFVVGILVAGLIAGGALRAAEPFPFDQELMLDVRPMRPVKRVPVINVEPNGAATINLWCHTVRGRVELNDRAIKIEPSPLPVALPRYMIDGQCTPQRIEADGAALAALTQVTAWRKQGGTVVLLGPQTLKFRPAGN